MSQVATSSVAGASRASPFSGHPAPSLLDDYTITRELGRGGCGAVYLATPKADGDPVAVKLMLSRAQADPRALCDIPPATSRAEVLTAVARVSATLGDAQRRLADSELSGIDPECARDVRGLMNDVIEDCRVVMAMLLPIAQFRDRTRCYPLLSKAHSGSECRKPWWRFW